MSSQSILLIDDDPDVQEALADCLSSAGFPVRIASDGQSALESLREGPAPSLILLDLRMPRLDGLAFRTVQRSRDELAQIPVVILTADREVAENWPGIDAAEIAYKPIQGQALLALVRRHLDPERTQLH